MSDTDRKVYRALELPEELSLKNVKDDPEQFKVKTFKKIPKEQLDQIVNSFVEIELIQPFQIIRETLTRVGVLKSGVLYQTAHILHKKNKYYIVHFKHLFALDGRECTYDEDDDKRLYKIIHLLKSWGLINIFSLEHDAMAEECKNVFVNIAKVGDIRENKVLLKKKYNL